MRIVVYGRPETQGSAQAFVRRDGRAQIVQGGSGERRRRLEDWRQAIRTEAQAVMGPEGTLLDGPVALVLSFGLPKPQSAPKKRRTWPIGARSGDIDKLERAVLDALTGVVWHDDSQVRGVLKEKDYAERPGIVIEVLSGDEGPAELVIRAIEALDSRPEGAYDSEPQIKQALAILSELVDALR